MAMEFKNRIQIDDTLKDIKKLYKSEWPKVIAQMFSNVAVSSQDAAQDRTRSQYHLHTDYIIKGIRATPATEAQRKRAEKSLSRYNDMFAAVYLRGSPNPGRSLEFMAQHENGYTRPARSTWASVGGQKFLAQPGPSDHFEEFRTKTNRGRIRKRFKPGVMLQKMREAGSTYDAGKKTTVTRKFPGRRGRNKAKVAGNWFVIQPKTSKVPAIARRVTRGSGGRRGELQIQWWLTKEQKIDNDYQFEKTVIGRAKRRYGPEARKMGSRIKL